ncbi:IMEF encapsulin system ferritin-like cargo protein [Brevibacillus fluminis]|uniref:IMEF encapsulin system ferritin-like cargo protein n=1 Tax=Brevibacillus fluminis TaxID=511487 RepID=UPI003F89F939
MQTIVEAHAIFERTKAAIGTFMSIIQPVIDNAQDEHTRLYYHHILEEEEQRLGRLEELIPYLKEISSAPVENLSDRELSHMLSDLNLERFGLHNFREHLELSLYEFSDEERRSLLNTMRESTQNDYLRMKDIMTELASRFSDVKLSSIEDHDHGHDIHQVDHLKASAKTATPAVAAPAAAIPAKKGLTVGSLRGK